MCDGPESACMTAWLKSAQKNISEFKREPVVAMFPFLVVILSHAWFSLPDGKRGTRRELSFFFFFCNFLFLKGFQLLEIATHAIDERCKQYTAQHTQHFLACSSRQGPGSR